MDLIIPITYFHRNNAEDALQKLNGTVIGKQTVRLSWGRNPANKQANSLFLCSIVFWKDVFKWQWGYEIHQKPIITLVLYFLFISPNQDI